MKPQQMCVERSGPGKQGARSLGVGWVWAWVWVSAVGGVQADAAVWVGPWAWVGPWPSAGWSRQGEQEAIDRYSRYRY
jgi:hypothetical protein